MNFYFLLKQGPPQNLGRFDVRYKRPNKQTADRQTSKAYIYMHIEEERRSVTYSYETFIGCDLDIQKKCFGEKNDNS